MIVAAKSALDERQLKDKKRKGAENIELHLTINDVQDKRQVQTQLITLQDCGMKIVSVHAPIERISTVEGLLSSIGFEIIENTCYLTQKISELQGNKVSVVLHQELGFEQLNNWGLADRVADELNILLKTFKDMTINIENSQFICVNRGEVFFSNNYEGANIKYCEYLRKYLRSTRVGVVINTSHIISAVRGLDRIDMFNDNLNLRDMIYDSKDYLNVVHLANGRGVGLGHNHACNFDTDKELETLRRIIDWLKNIEFKGILVLELNELNYLDCVEFEKLFKQVNNLLNGG